MTTQESLMKYLIAHPMKKFKGANALAVAAGLALNEDDAYHRIGGTPVKKLVEAGRVQRSQLGHAFLIWYDPTKDPLAVKARRRSTTQVLSVEQRIHRLEIQMGIVD